MRRTGDRGGRRLPRLEHRSAYASYKYMLGASTRELHALLEYYYNLNRTIQSPDNGQVITDLDMSEQGRKPEQRPP